MPNPVFSRRQFLLSASASVAVAGSSSTAFASWFKMQNPTGQETIILCDMDNPPDNPPLPPGVPLKRPNFPLVNPPGSINAFNTVTRQITKIDIPFFGHTTIQDPRQPQRIVSFEKWGTRSVLVDIKTKSILAHGQAEPGYMFFGHAAYIRNGEALVASEDSYKADDGKLAVMDPNTLEIKQSMSSYGSGPHQCMLLDDGKTLLVANGGAPERDIGPNITWIDADTGNRVKTVDMAIEPYSIYGHIDYSYDGWVAACGFVTTRDHAFTHARAALISPEGKIIPLALPDGILSETLSVAFLGQSGMVAMTMPGADAMYIWSYHDQALVGKIVAHAPNGVLPGLGFGTPSVVVSIASRHKHMAEFSIDSDKQFPHHKVDEGFGGLGSHLLRAYI